MPDNYTLSLNIAIVVVIVGLVALLFYPKIRKSEIWKATVTPLASIIGSGFLVVAPLLYFHFGKYSPLAILALSIFAYLIGSVLRSNILAESKQSKDNLLNKVSYIGLFVAYVVSVAFYIELLSSFLVHGIGLNDGHSEVLKRVISTVILLVIAARSYFKELNGLETMEKIAVSGKLAIIGGLLIGLVGYNINFLNEGFLHLKKMPGLDAFRVLMGSVVVVQGFETSKFLGNKYSQQVRVSSMRYSQIISGLIYVVFVSLMLIVFKDDVEISDTAIIDLTQKVSVLLPPILVLAAVLSQFSAATADTIGAGGLLGKLNQKFTGKWVYFPVILAAIALVWTTDVFQIIAIASRCFATYYAVECLTAGLRFSQHSKIRMLGAFVLALSLVMCAVFGLPAEN